MPQYDAIVCGSGITGGWAAKELTERGLTVLMLERGPNLEHRTDYKTEFKAPWELPFRGFTDPKILATSKRFQQHGRLDEWSKDMFVDDDVDVYESPQESGFRWIRGYHLGGRSVMWGRHSYRMAPLHFRANAEDGHGVPWPIGYDDLKPWYEHAERYIGVNGTVEGNLPGLPDGIYQPSMGFNAAEQRLADAVRAHYKDRRVLPGRTANLTRPIGDRLPCHNRDQCARGCSFGAYFSTQSSTLPAAQATGRLTVQTDSVVDSLEYDAAGRRVTGVRIVDARTGATSVARSKLVFLCAGSVNSVSILLRSASSDAPGGIGNSSGVLGKYLMDHCFAGLIMATVPGIDDQMYSGRKPNGLVVPRWVNVDKREADFLRGYSFQGGSGRDTWKRGGHGPGIGVALKQELRKPGPWMVGFGMSVECLPDPRNTITLSATRKDRHGMPLTRLDLRWRENELKAAAHAREEATRMLSLLGGRVMPVAPIQAPGTAIHEAGGACMGADPRRSVTNAHNQLHDAMNVYVTDGAAMSSTGDRNPSLTYMAMTIRAAAHAADHLKHGAA
jgi:choline dehydrogenase-like flavoprotein